MPLVRLVDSAGGSVKLLMQIGGTKIPEYTTWPAQDLLRTVPVVGVALGACAGQGAIKVLSSHFSVMVRDQAQVMAAGPHVVRQAYGVDVDKNDLGGWKAHRKSALVHNEAVDEADAWPRCAASCPTCRAACTSWRRCYPATTTPTADDWLKDAIPHDRRKIYDPRKHPGQRVRPGVDLRDRPLAGRLGDHRAGPAERGVPVGVIANDPKAHGGAMTLQAAYKMERHVKLCSLFGLPVVNFVDQPGNADRAGRRAGRHAAGRHAWSARRCATAVCPGCRS
jgi:acetyl-CoA carboxylase carboxyltransferase component